MERNEFGKNINKVRKDRGMTADHLAEKCNINTVYLQQIEGGKRTPSLPVFISLCNALQISPDYILQDVLTNNEITQIKKIDELWRTSSPRQQKLVLAMIETVLSFEDQ